jgi:hypothetical protein
MARVVMDCVWQTHTSVNPEHAVPESSARSSFFLTPLIYVPSTAEQGARANAGICHASCDRRSFEMKPQMVNRSAARGAPAPIVAHL